MGAAWSQLGRADDAVTQRMRRFGPGTLAAVALVALLALAQPLTALWILAGLAACGLAVLRPRVLCYLLVPAVAFGTLAQVKVGPLRAGPTDLIVGALALGMLVRLWPQWPRLTHRRTAITMRTAAGAVRAWWRRDPAFAAPATALSAYLLVLVASMLWAANRSLALKEVIKWAEVLVVFVIAVLLLRRPVHLAIAAGTMLAVGLAEALLGYGQWVVSAGDLGVNGSGVRVFGTFDQPNPYAAYLNLSLPIALALALFGRPARTRWIAGGAAALLLGAQLLANSRGGLLALAAAVLVVVLVGLGVERLAIGLGAVVALIGGLAWAAGVLPHAIQDRVLRLFRVDTVSLTGPVNDANFSSTDRLAHWVAGIRMFLAHPVLGVGAGNYDAAYPRYAVPGWHASLLHAHNYYINAAAETGVIGLAAFLALVGSMLYVGWRAAHAPSAAASAEFLTDGAASSARPDASIVRLRRLLALDRPLSAIRTGSWTRALGLGLLGMFVTVVVHSVVDDLFVHAMELQIALCLALAVTLARSSRAAEPGLSERAASAATK